MINLGLIISPILGVLFAGAAAVGMAISGLHFSPKAIEFKLSQINPISGFTKLVNARSLIKLLMYNPKIFDTDKITGILSERGHLETFDNRLLNATYFLSGTFFFSAVMNYLLATWIVTSPSGSAAFNEELGRLTLLSYPVIAIPSMVMMLLIFYFLWRSTHTLTGLKLEEMLAPSLVEDE